MIDPVICPKCLKPTCKKCLEKYVNEKKECPHCRQKIKKEDLKRINFLDDVLSFYSKIEEAPKTEICEQHHMEKDIYCSTCSVACCSHCILLKKEHKGHQIEDFSQIYEPKYEELTKNLRKKIEKFEEKAKKVEECPALYDQTKTKLYSQHYPLYHKISDEFDDRMGSLKYIMNFLTNSVVSRKKEIFSLYANKINELQSKTKADFISDYNNLKSEIDNISPKIEEAEEADELKFAFKDSIINDYIPGYKTIKIPFDAFEEVQEVPFKLYGINWILKYDPELSNGYIGVFLQLNENLKKPLIIKFKMAMINQRGLINEEGTFSYVYYKKLSNGFGCSEFYQRQFLKRDGFINVMDEIEIEVSLRPLTYGELYEALNEN